jgi:CHAT domain-containing protein
MILLTSSPWAQNADEAALRALVEKFFAAYTKKNLDGVMALWSAKSPEFVQRKQTMQRLFATLARIEVNSPNISRLETNEGQARMRLSFDMSGWDAQTGELAQGSGKMRRTMHCIWEEGVWKIWRYYPAVDDFAAALVAAKTAEERAALLKTWLTTDNELVTAELVKALDRQSNLLRSQANHAQAIAVNLIACDVAELIGDKVGAVNALKNIGSLYAAQSNFTEALKFFQKSLPLYEALGNKLGVAFVWINVGVIQREQGNYTQAVESYQKSLRLYEELDDKKGIAAVYNNMGNVSVLRGNYTEAVAHFQKSLAISEAAGDKTVTANTLHNLGVICDEQGDYDTALEFYQKSLAQFEVLGDKKGIAANLNSIGSVYRVQGNYLRGLEFFQKSLKQYETIGDQKGMTIALGNIGILYGNQGDYAQALEFYRKVLSIQETLGDQAGMSITLNHIGNVHSMQGNNAQALEFYQKSLATKETLGDKAGAADILHNVGLVHDEQGNYAQALEFYQKSLAMTEALGNQAMTASTLSNLASLHQAQGNFTQALECAQRSAEIAKRIGSPEIRWRALRTVGQAYRGLSQFVPARQAFDEAITLVENLRVQVAGGERQQQHFFEKKVSPYYEMVELLISQNNPADALTYAERIKGRVLLDVLHTGRINVTKAMTDTERERERALNTQLVSLNTQIFRESQRKELDENRLVDLKTRLQKARLDYEAFQTGLYVTHSQLKTQRGEAQSITLEETNTLLSDVKTALLEFVVTETKTYLFILSSPEPRTPNPEPMLKVYTIDIQQKDLAERVTRLREMVAANRGGFPRLARELYDLLLKPAQAQWQGKTNLIIVPDGVLWELPFQALQSKENRYLIEDAAIAYAPSLTVLREMERQGAGFRVVGSGETTSKTKNPKPTTATLLALGNPSLGKETVERVQLVHRDENLNPLPEAEKEVRDLGQLYGVTRCKVYVGADAHEERVKSEAGNYRILHFATHGLLNDRSPMYSQVLLAQMPSPPTPLPTAGEGSEDGLLEAWEIMNLDLKADLVVLSACETARGRVSAGEGVIGLAWALFVAGCPTTVVSQWKVADSSTSQLMVEFHRQLRTQSKAEALRQAQLKLMKDGKHRHPFYWAAFVLVGDGR